MKINNKSVSFDYKIKETVEAGIKLTGPEVKSVKASRVSLSGSFIKIVGSEIFLINASIEPYAFASPPVGSERYDPRRTRKLLLSKKEILNFQNKLSGANFALVPVSMYTKHGLIKVEVGMGVGKKQYEKREAMKKRAEELDIERQFRGKIR
jgi:SsrA-binding protein